LILNVKKLWLKFHPQSCRLCVEISKLAFFMSKNSLVTRHSAHAPRFSASKRLLMAPFSLSSLNKSFSLPPFKYSTPCLPVMYGLADGETTPFPSASALTFLTFALGDKSNFPQVSHKSESESMPSPFFNMHCLVSTTKLSIFRPLDDVLLPDLRRLGCVSQSRSNRHAKGPSQPSSIQV